METTQHKLPNYMLIWLYLFVLTAAEVLFAFEMPISQLAKIVCLLVLAVVKALLVALFFMHLKFERWRVPVVFMIPPPPAAVLVLAVITEDPWRPSSGSTNRRTPRPGWS